MSSIFALVMVPVRTRMAIAAIQQQHNRTTAITKMITGDNFFLPVAAASDCWKTAIGYSSLVLFGFLEAAVLITAPAMVVLAKALVSASGR